MIPYELLTTNQTSTKEIIFTILSKEHPLKLIELTNYIRKRYGKSVTFQAVRKAALELMEKEILIKKNNKFEINKEWIRKTRQELETLQKNLSEEAPKPKNIESIHDEISVFSFDSPNDMMKFWYSIIENWANRFRQGEYNVNCYQAPHIWELLLHPDKEKKIMTTLKDKGIISYSLTTGGTPLDRHAKRFYEKIGIHTEFIRSLSDFNKTYFVGTYGETIVQIYYPKEIIEKLEEFYKKNNNLENLDLHKLSEIMNQKVKTKMTVIKNIEMAKQINKSIIDQII